MKFFKIITVIILFTTLGLAGCANQLPVAKDMALNTNISWCSQNILSKDSIDPNPEGRTDNSQLSRYHLSLFGGHWDVAQNSMIHSSYSYIGEIIEIYKSEKIAREKYVSLDYDLVKYKKATPITFPLIGEELKAWYNPILGNLLGDPTYIIFFRVDKVLVQLNIALDFEFLQDTVKAEHPKYQGGDVLAAMEDISLSKAIEATQQSRDCIFNQLGN